MSYRNLVIGLINKFASTPDPAIKDKFIPALTDFVSKHAYPGVSGIGLARLNQIHQTILGSVPELQAVQSDQVQHMKDAVLKAVKALWRLESAV